MCEPCVWICKDAQGVVQGVLASHVDDFIVTGNESNELWMKTLTTFHQALKWSPWEPDPYIHCGVEGHQQANYGFNLSHEQYASQIKQIEIDKSCSHVTPSELSQAKAVLGAIQWRVSQTAPQHAAKLSLLQSMLPHGKESKDVLVQINKLVREVFAQRGLSVKVQQLEAASDSELVIIGWSDAAVANRPDLSSTGAYVVGLCHQQILSGVRSPVNLIAWRSGKLHRTARSSLSAELQALGEAEQEVMFCRALWSELLGHPFNPRCPEQSTKLVKSALVIDAKSAFDAYHKGEGASAAFSLKEKYSALELLAIRENMVRQDTQLLWVSSEAQLADGLTKASAQDQFRLFMLRGQCWNVKYDPQFTAAKKKPKVMDDRLDEMSEVELEPDCTWQEFIQRRDRPLSKTFRPFQKLCHLHESHEHDHVDVGQSRRHLGIPFANRDH